MRQFSLTESPDPAILIEMLDSSEKD